MPDFPHEMDQDIDVQDFDEDEQEGEKCCSCLRHCMESCDNSPVSKKIKKIFTFVVTNLGLVMLVTCYCLMGAVMFELFEGAKEIQVVNFH